jgi:hypothetical protein
MLGQIVCFLVLASILWSGFFSRAGDLDAARHGVDDFLDAVAIRRDNSMTLEIPFDIIVSTPSPDTRYVFEYLLTCQSRSQENQGPLYMFNCSVGTPPQTISIAIMTWFPDTQLSSTLNVYSDGTYTTKSGGCINPQIPFSIVYTDMKHPDNPGGSSTHLFNTTFAHYGIDDYTTGVFPSANPDNFSSINATYSLDDLTVAGVALPNFTFIEELQGACASAHCFWNDYLYGPDPDAEDPQESYQLFPNSYWLGLGLPADEAYLWQPGYYGGGSPYPTFLTRLVNQGVIQSPTYSIWLDSDAEKSGHLLLGGVNSKRYQGDLVSLPTSLWNAQLSADGFLESVQLTVGISYLSVTSSTNTTTPIPVPNTFEVALGYLNTAFPQPGWSNLPPSITTAIWDAVGGEYDKSVAPNDAYAVVPCSFLSNSSTLDIVFNGASDLTLSVPMSAITYHNGSGPTFTDGQFAQGCNLAIGASGPGLPSWISNNMMQRLYTVYDLRQNVISVALTDFGSTEDNVVPIPTGGVAAIATGLIDNVSSTPSPTASPAAKSSSSLKVGLGAGLGTGIPVLALALGALYFFFSRRQHTQTPVVVVNNMGDEEKGVTKSNEVGELDGEEDSHSPEVKGGGRKHRESELDASEVPKEVSSPDPSYRLSELPGDGEVKFELDGLALIKQKTGLEPAGNEQRDEHAEVVEQVKYRRDEEGEAH